MLSEIVKDKLIQNLKWCYPETIQSDKKGFVVTEDDKIFFVEKFGIANRDSAFIDYYTVVAVPMVGNGDELYTLEQLMDAMEYDEYEDIEGMDSFIRISSLEGEGSYFYCPATDEVFDVTWGEEDALANRLKKASFSSFYEFLNWYYG